jgi:hypothetical protein
MNHIDKIIEREFADPLITHDNNKAKIYQQDQLRALLQEAVDGAMGKVGCPSCGDSCEHEWVLISPENLRFTGKSAFEVVRKEMNSRIPPAKQLENIIKANEAAEFDYQADVAMAVAKAERKDAKRLDWVVGKCRCQWSGATREEIDAAIAAEGK